MAERKVTNVATDKKDGMDLFELEVFLADCREARLAPSSKIRVLAGFSGQVKRVEATDEVPR